MIGGSKVRGRTEATRRPRPGTSPAPPVRTGNNELKEVERIEAQAYCKLRLATGKQEI
jgi:hypothetical protein